MEKTLPSNLIFGDAALATLLGVSLSAIHTARHRGKWGIEPVFKVGKSFVFDGDQARDYAEQRRKQAKK